MRRDGSRCLAGGVVTAMRDARGRLVAFSVVMRDVTAERQAAAVLQASETRFRTMADTAPVLIWIADTTRGGSWFNKPWLEFVGRPLTQEIGHGWLENIHPDDYLRSLAAFNRHFDAREPFKLDWDRMRRHDGEWPLGRRCTEHRCPARAT